MSPPSDQNSFAQANTGAVFSNSKNRDKDDKAPDHRGRIDITAACPHCGKMFSSHWWVSAFNSRSRKNVSYLRLLIRFVRYIPLLPLSDRDQAALQQSLDSPVPNATEEGPTY